MIKKLLNKIVMLCVVFSVTGPIFSEPLPTLQLGTGSSLWLTGDSTLHPYTSKTQELFQSSRLDLARVPSGVSLWDAVLKSTALKELELKIPVKTLKSKESGLDKNMYRALKAETYPEINFRLSSYAVQASTINERASQVKAAGMLTIAGKEQPVLLTIEATPEEAGLRIQGHTALLMSEYGIKPPSLMLGAIKVKDPVEIHFDLHWQVMDNK